MSVVPPTDAVSFPRNARLLKPRQFQLTFSQGRRLNSTLFRLHVHLACPATASEGKADPRDMATTSCPREIRSLSKTSTQMGSIARLGISVSKRVAHSAVERNRIRRVARESFRHVRLKLPPGDYALLAQRESAGASTAAICESLSLLWRRVDALKQTGSTPTIPIPALKSADLLPASELPIQRG